MDLFTFKKIVGHLIMPLPMIFALLVIGLYWTAKKRAKLAVTFQLLGLALLALLSTPHFSSQLLSPLEKTYRQYDFDQKVKVIVILGCGHSNDGTLPITAQLYSCSLYRLAEGIRIYRANPGSRIITSGYGGTEEFSNAYMVKETAIALGVPEADITVFESPKDTQEEAKALFKPLQNTSFALVTSASHMRRAMHIFEAQGLKPIAAPTGHLAKDSSRAPWWEYLPQSSNITKVEKWWRETMGYIWQKIKN